MIRTQEQWWDGCTSGEIGTHGGLVFDILSDWKDDRDELIAEIERLRAALRMQVKLDAARDEQRERWENLVP